MGFSLLMKSGFPTASLHKNLRSFNLVSLNQDSLKPVVGAYIVDPSTSEVEAGGSM